MPTYIVTNREVWARGTRVEAESPEEAKEKVGRGEGEEVPGLFEYTHTLDSELWEVEEDTLHTFLVTEAVHGYYLQTYEIRAESEDAARAKVYEGDLEPIQTADEKMESFTQVDAFVDEIEELDTGATSIFVNFQGLCENGTCAERDCTCEPRYEEKVLE